MMVAVEPQDADLEADLEAHLDLELDEHRPMGPLRRGWTTGACATAAAKAAYTALLGGIFPDPVEITLPRGQRVWFALATELLRDESAAAGIVKDAGDDPDVTHGALVVATVRHGQPGSGVTFSAGEGVGTITLPGLPLAVGQPAINPVPRQMMSSAIAEVATDHGASGDVHVEISVPGGAEIALHTWNPRLGIVGGLSILGTTGVVIPYSCAAWIHSIRRGVDLARAVGHAHVAGCTGSTSELAVQQRFSLPDTAMLDMGDFAGGLLKYVRLHPVPRLTIGGGFAKLSKLADGHMDLHSGRSQVDIDALAQRLAAVGASADVVAAASAANTALGVLEAARTADPGLATALTSAVCEAARLAALGALGASSTEVDVVVVDRDGTILAESA